ncbi:54S ribosomal protein L7, mitochondrial [Tilletia horrida]|nr:54S ribosomal protein L7, mitochondrial [Tilletia horrida]
MNSRAPNVRTIALIIPSLRKRLPLVGAYYQQNQKKRGYKRNANETIKVAVFLGSGGHTAEMLTLVSSLDPDRYRQRVYYVSDGDQLSANKARLLETRLVSARTDQIQQATSATESAHFQVKELPRARRVHQSFATTPLSAARSFLVCLDHVVTRPLSATWHRRSTRSTTTNATSSYTQKDDVFADLLLLNGPGTCVPLVLAVYVRKFFGLHAPHIMYIESFARVQSLSLSAKLLKGLVDTFVVQWPEASKDAECRGWLREARQTNPHIRRAEDGKLILNGTPALMHAELCNVQPRRTILQLVGMLPHYVEPRTATPQRPLTIGPTGLSRLQEHYNSVLAPDLLYMTYDAGLETATEEERAAEAHKAATKGVREWDTTSPYTQNRPNRPPRGNRQPQPLSKPISSTDPLRDLVRLEKVVITAFHKAAIGNKNALVPLVAQFRAITGVSPLGSLSDPAMLVGGRGGGGPPDLTRGHIEVVKARVGAASFKLRPGMPVGVKATLPGPLGLDFLDVLVTFVLPRLRGFQGFLLPPSSQPPASPAAMSGVVSLGMGPDAMALFPQTEVNWDQYPLRGLGFQIDCITNQRGKHATERARTLLSGLGLPFVRRAAL